MHSNNFLTVFFPRSRKAVFLGGVFEFFKEEKILSIVYLHTVFQKEDREHEYPMAEIFLIFIFGGFFLTKPVFFFVWKFG